MKQQIIVSGLGGQGAVTLTRLLAEAALLLGLPVITSETHGMAQRGGAVISMVKVGPYKGPLIPAGSADAGLFLEARNLAVHGYYLKEGGLRFVNTATPGDYLHLDARGLAANEGLPPVAANLILLGYAAAKGGFFCEADLLEQVISAKTPPKLAQASLQAFRAGVAAALTSSF